ncbi:MAG: hypothetical protein R3F56_01045 [Planctomycetota bacterium]
MQSDAHRRDRRRPPAPLALLIMLLPLACAVFGGGGDTNPNAWDERRGPVVPHDSFPTDCSLCHQGTDWNSLRPDFTFDHLAKTGVALNGAHAQAQCLRCHNDRGPVARFAGRGCAGCHEDVHQGRLGPDCRSCHDENTWRPQELRAEHASTRFPLVGAHAAVGCYRCHIGAEAGNFQRVDTRCESCHQADLARATNPDHIVQGWTSDCQRCHGPTVWSRASFAHEQFPLIGRHQSARCQQCHVNNVFRGTPQQCAACHQAEYDRTTDPNHGAAGFSTQCEQCHDARGWEGARVDHSFYPLEAAHATAACSACHVNGVYHGTPRNCVACHQDDYNGATSPNHATAGFPNTCQTCHNTRSWNDAYFDHGHFPLTGRHQGVACANCHQNNVYEGTPRDCVGCHQADYNRTTNPNHAAANYPTTCEQCHTTNGWEGAITNHNIFPLTGRHATTQCAQCHVNNVFLGTPRTCVGCHQTDYNRTTNPNHAAASFPTNCDVCHNTTQWQGATFDHSTYPLTGAHNAVACGQCHVNNVYRGTPRDCYGCHRTDYQNVRDPDHARYGFPTDCTRCHNTTTWSGATFSHQFPLTGNHNTSCSTCHTVSGSPTYTCFGCHTHSQTRMDDKHSGVRNYVYESTACVRCHPNGRH